MFLSPTDASRIYEVSKVALYKDMGDGIISYETDAKGKRRKINVAELDRVYDKRTNDDITISNKNVNVHNEDTEANVTHTSSKVAKFETQISDLRAQVKKRDEDLEHWIAAHGKAQATADKIMALIEYKGRNEETSQYKQEMEDVKSALKDIKKQNEERDKQEEDRRLALQNMENKLKEQQKKT